jgi:secretion/DNA translocation related TadE-like protein
MSGERGSASVVGIGVLAAVAVIALTVVAASATIADAARARSAADLAALAGATVARASLAGAGADPCAAARETARANHASLTACDVLGDGSVRVTAASGRATASARAGPQRKGPGGGSG